MNLTLHTSLDADKIAVYVTKGYVSKLFIPIFQVCRRERSHGNIGLPGVITDLSDRPASRGNICSQLLRLLEGVQTSRRMHGQEILEDDDRKMYQSYQA